MAGADTSLGSIQTGAATSRPASSSLLTGAIAFLALALNVSIGVPRVHAQYALEHWTAADGLPSNKLTRVRQGVDGYIWIGTDRGLARYDGARFVTFNRTQYPALPSDNIERVQTASDSSVWLQTTDRQAVHFRNGSFVAYDGADGLPRGATYLFAADREVRLNAGGRIFRYAGHTFHSEETQPRDTYGRLYKSPSGVSWFATQEHGLIRYRDGVYRAFTVEDGLRSNRVEPIEAYAEDQDVLWFLAGRRLHRLENETVTIVPLDLDIAYVFREPKGRWWIATSDAMYRSATSDPTQLERMDEVGADLGWEPKVDETGQVWTNSRHHLWRDGKPMFTHPDISHFLIDGSGGVWIATAGDGLYRLKPVPFRVYGPLEGISYPVVLPVLEDRDGVIWAGTQQGGVNRLVTDTVVTGQLPGLPSQHVFALHEDHDGMLWVGTDQGVCRVERGVCRRYPGLDFDQTTRAIWQDSKGVFWFGTENGLYRYRDDRLERLTTRNGLSSDWVHAIVEGADGILWMATNGGGLMAYRNGKFSVLRQDQGLAADAVRAVYEDADGVIWVGSEGGGLTRIALASGIDIGGNVFAGADIRILREEDGLFDPWLHLVLEDDTGRMWMTSNRGIFWIWKHELDDWAAGRQTNVHSVVYGEADGLRSAAGNGRIQPAGIKARDGRLWFPTENGLAVVDPSELYRFEVPPVAVVERMEVWGQTQPIHAGTIALEAAKRVITLEYTALAWPNGARTRFQYKMEGHDDDWIDAEQRRHVVYGGLGPGGYTFRVRAINHAGIQSLRDATLSLTIAPFYYERVWFWLASVALALTLIGGGYRWRLRSHIERERRLESQVAERTAEVARQADELRSLDRAKSRFFANISHEFRTPLTLSMGPLEDVRSDLHGPVSSEAKRRIDLALLNNRRLLRLVNQLLDIARLEAHTLTLHARPVNLSALLGGLMRAFSPLAERKHVTLIHDLPDLESAIYADPDQLEKIFTNLLSNAFKFTPEDGRIQVEVEANPSRVSCADTDSAEWIVVRVRDSGPGIPPDQVDQIFDRFYQTETGSNHADAGTGIGLALVRELVTLHRGCVDVTIPDGGGTSFNVYLRTGTAHLKGRDEVNLSYSSIDADGAVPSDPSASHAEIIERADVVTSPPVSADDDVDEDRLTILIVDDNAEVRAFIREHLEGQYRTVEASDGRAGLAEARAVTPDLILSDVMMPEMDGYELCREVKEDPELGFIPVILLTARAGSEDKLEGLEGGADDYLTKPFDMAELKTRIANLIALRQRLRAKFQAAANAIVPVIDVKSTDDVFREGVLAAIEANLADENFGVVQLADAVAIDRTHLYRRMMETLGKSPSAYIKELRLERAAGLLRARAGTVSEIAYGVGFKSVPHFTTVFRERYGCTPTQYAG